MGACVGDLRSCGGHQTHGLGFVARLQAGLFSRFDVLRVVAAATTEQPVEFFHPDSWFAEYRASRDPS